MSLHGRRSARLLSPGLCRHCAEVKLDGFFATRLHMNVVHLFASLRIHPIVIMESLQSVVRLTSYSAARQKYLKKFVPFKAANSCSPERVVLVIGDSVVFSKLVPL